MKKIKRKYLLFLLIPAAIIAFFVINFIVTFDLRELNLKLKMNFHVREAVTGGSKILFSRSNQFGGDGVSYSVIQYNVHDMEDVLLPESDDVEIYDSKIDYLMSEEEIKECDEIIDFLVDNPSSFTKKNEKEDSSIPDKYIAAYDEIDKVLRIEKRYTDHPEDINSLLYVLQDEDNKRLYILENYFI